VTEANHRSTQGVIGQFLQAALQLQDPQHYEGLISMDVVGQVIGLEDRTRLLQITETLINNGLLVQDPYTGEIGTDEIGLFRFTPEGLAAARRQIFGERILSSTRYPGHAVGAELAAQALGVNIHPDV